MKLKSIRARLFLFIAVILLLSLMALSAIFLNSLMDRTDARYHSFLDAEKDFTKLVIEERIAIGDPGEFAKVMDQYMQLKEKLQILSDTEDLNHLSLRQGIFEKLYGVSRQIEYHHQQIRQLMPNLTDSVRYIHEHHIAYLKNLLRRGQTVQDYDVGKEFKRSPVQAAPELDTIRMAVAIQNRLLELFELFNRARQEDNPSTLQTSFQEKIQKFYAAVNTFEDYSLDAQDGLLVEELLLTGRQFETSFTSLLAGESEIASLSKQLEENTNLMMQTFRTVLDQINTVRQHRMALMRTIQYAGALGFVLLVGFILYYSRRLDKAFQRTVSETQHLQANIDYQIPVHVNEAREFRIVYDAMNAMARTINEQVTDLETAHSELSERVQARTAALERANQQLKREIEDRETAEKLRIELETKLNRAKKMEAVGTLAGGVAHDLNNILSGIVSYPDLILNDLPVDHPFRPALETIRSSGEKAAAIVQDLLTLARRGVNVSEAVDLRRIVEAYCSSPEFIRLKADNPHIRFEFDFRADTAPIKGSHVHLEKTVMNLVSNAAEAISEQGTITLAIENVYIDTTLKGYDVVKEGDYVKLTVTDDGSGIAENDLERIFEPFFTKKKMGRSGTGLGMAVVWGTVKDHNGYIDVQSRQGQGSTFSLYFPLNREIRAARKPFNVMDILKGKGQSILVVDDIAEQREIAVMILSRLGYAPTAVQNGTEAVAHIHGHAVDLLLLDMIMEPGMDGLDTYRQILDIRPGTPAVIASGFAETQRVREAQKLGACRYIRKPYTIENIAQAVQEALIQK